MQFNFNLYSDSGAKFKGEMAQLVCFLFLSFPVALTSLPKTLLGFVLGRERCLNSEITQAGWSGIPEKKMRKGEKGGFSKMNFLIRLQTFCRVLS